MKFPEEMIYNSQKPIALIDVPENHPIVKEIKNYESEMKGKKIFHYGNFAQTMESFKKALAEEAFLEKEREEYILSQLKPQVDALLNEYPNLRDKQGISILLSLGVSHTSLYHSLKKENFEVTRIFNKMPFVYPYRNEVVRRYLFGKSVDDLLLSRALTEVLFWEAFGAQLDENEGHDSQKIAEFTRRLISAFSFDEIKNMFEGASKFDEWPSFLYMNLKKGFETS